MPEKGANIALLLGMCAFAFAGIGFFIGGAWLFLSTFGSDDRASSFVNHVLRRSHADILHIGAFAVKVRSSDSRKPYKFRYSLHQ